MRLIDCHAAFHLKGFDMRRESFVFFYGQRGEDVNLHSTHINFQLTMYFSLTTLCEDAGDLRSRLDEARRYIFARMSHTVRRRQCYTNTSNVRLAERLDYLNIAIGYE